MSDDGPPLAGVRPDLTILGLCALYECADPAAEQVRMQPKLTGGLVYDVPLCSDHAELVRENLPGDDRNE